MIAPVFVVLALAIQTQAAPRSSGPATTTAAATSSATTKSVPSDPAENSSLDDLSAKLLHVKRIYVDSFGDDAISKQVQAMVNNSLSESKRFIITENKDKADALLKGTALEKTSQEFHGSSEGTGVASVGGSHHGFVGGAARTDDSVASTETINNARVAVRLVDKDGDVIWTSTQESTGAKYKGAGADVADQVVKKLLRDLDKLQKKTSGEPPAN